MKFVLFALMLILSACSMDLQLRNSASSSNGSSPVISSSIVSVELRPNGNDTEVYYSNDQTNFSLLQSIPGDFRGSSFSYYGYRGDLKDNGFILIEKNGSSPAGWADRTLWYVGTQAESIEKYIDVPVSSVDCDMANHTDFLNMYCRDGSYNSLIYQVDKNSKALVSVIDKWGYVGDSTYDFVAESLYSRVTSTTETVAVYKVLKADTSVKELVDLYVYTGSDFRKVTISGADLAALKTDTSLAQYEQLTVGAQELLLMSGNNSNNSTIYLLVVDVSNPTAPSLSKHLLAYSSDVLGVIGDKVVLKPWGGGTHYQTYSTASGVQDTTIVMGDVMEQVHGNSIFVAGSATSFKKCDISGSCSTLVNDFSTSWILTFGAEGFQQQKIYFIDQAPAEADRVIQSVDVATGAVVTETVLTNILKAKSIGMGSVGAINRYGDNISVLYNNAGTKYLILNKNDLAVKDEFLGYCSGNSDFPIQNHKYFTPLFEGWNNIVMSFGCS